MGLIFLMNTALDSWEVFILYFRACFTLSIFTLLCLCSSSVSLSDFLLAVLLHKCWGLHSRMCSTFSITILNGTNYNNVFFLPFIDVQ